VNDIDRQAIIAEIAALTEPPTLEEGEITSLMLAETKGITRRKAAAQLEKACEGDSPILTMRKVQHDGRRVNAYSQVLAERDNGRE